MYNNTSKLMFLLMTIMGTILSISSTSWLGVWIGLEMNLLSFIPMMSDNKNSLMNEASIKYFMIQAMASTTLLFTIMLILMKSSMYLKNSMIPSMMISLSLLMKAGAAPLHFWFPEVMKNSNWINCLMLMTWQKIAPMIMISYCMKSSLMLNTTILLSIIFGAIGGLNQTEMKQLMAYSSISHLGWMISLMMTNEQLWETYFMVYSMLTTSLTLTFKHLNINYMNQLYMKSNNMKMKIMLIIPILSIGGLPPFLGFLPKWLTIQCLIENNMMIIPLTMMIMTTITLYFYMKISFTALMLNYMENSWKSTKYKPKIPIIMMTSTTLSSMGLLMIPLKLMF
uniref:NADH-ubiquinone oxidoreductase chain 2 n=1 Tax=Trigonopteryx hopei TaxID=62799 RepID=M4JC49_9ORTH|nr:NADH dehydrogenase subunit 2 [Trigonopteryx hopei]